jgi:hypothetical protein
MAQYPEESSPGMKNMVGMNIGVLAIVFGLLVLVVAIILGLSSGGAF